MNSNDTDESQKASQSANGTQSGTHSEDEGYETQILSMIEANSKVPLSVGSMTKAGPGTSTVASAQVSAQVKWSS